MTSTAFISTTSVFPTTIPVSATVVAAMFAIIIYKLKMLQLKKPAAVGGDFDDDEEEEI